MGNTLTMKENLKIFGKFGWIGNVLPPLAISKTKINFIFSLWEWEKWIDLVCCGLCGPFRIENEQIMNGMIDLWMNNEEKQLAAIGLVDCSCLPFLWGVMGGARPALLRKGKRTKTRRTIQSNQQSKKAIKRSEIKQFNESKLMEWD